MARAKVYVHTLQLKSWREWTEWSKSGQRPVNIPSRPSQMYRDEGWVSMPDWLGYKGARRGAAAGGGGGGGGVRQRASGKSSAEEKAALGKKSKEGKKRKRGEVDRRANDDEERRKEEEEDLIRCFLYTYGPVSRPPPEPVSSS